MLNVNIVSIVGVVNKLKKKKKIRKKKDLAITCWRDSPANLCVGVTRPPASQICDYVLTFLCGIVRDF